MTFCSKCGESLALGNKYCAYCGTSVQDNYKGETRVLLGNQLNELASKIEALENVMAETERVNAQLIVPEPNEPRLVSRWWGMKKAVITGAILAYVGFICILGTVKFGVGLALFGAILIIISIILIIIGALNSRLNTYEYNKKVVNQYLGEINNGNQLMINAQSQMMELRKSRFALATEIQNLMIFNGNDIEIPEEYFNAEVIRFFADYIFTGRASSIVEVKNAYDVYMHERKMKSESNEVENHHSRSVYQYYYETVLYLKSDSKSEQKCAEYEFNLKNPSIGSEICFGHYSDGERIIWKILRVQSNKILIFSINSICSMPYHQPGGSITWSDSTIRYWLNNNFFNNYFTPAEQSRILPCRNYNPENFEPGYSGGVTTDKVFLLDSFGYREYHDNIGHTQTNFWWLRTLEEQGGIGQKGFVKACCVKPPVVMYYENSKPVNANANVHPVLWLELNSTN